VGVILGFHQFDGRLEDPLTLFDSRLSYVIDEFTADLLPLGGRTSTNAKAASRAVAW